MTTRRFRLALHDGRGLALEQTDCDATHGKRAFMIRMTSAAEAITVEYSYESKRITVVAGHDTLGYNFDNWYNKREDGNRQHFSQWREKANEWQVNEDDGTISPFGCRQLVVGWRQHIQLVPGGDSSQLQLAEPPVAPPAWLHQQDQCSCYILNPLPLPFDVHERLANLCCGHIASPTTARAKTIVCLCAHLAPYCFFGSSWIGGRRIGTGNGPGPEHWEWVNGAQWDYTNWADGEPNSEDGSENRVCQYCFWVECGKWNDLPGWCCLPAVYQFGGAQRAATGQMLASVLPARLPITRYCGSDAAAARAVAHVDGKPIWGEIDTLFVPHCWGLENASCILSVEGSSDNQITTGLKDTVSINVYIESLQDGSPMEIHVDGSDYSVNLQVVDPLLIVC
jgi:hypothetical protein